MQPNASRGVKRRRQSSVWALSPDFDDHDDEELSETPTKGKSKRILSQKRVRRQSGNAPTKWTKVEVCVSHL